jgi:hypothetical protein
MMVRKTLAAMALLGMSLGGLAACSDSYDRGDFVKSMENAGATNEQANCIADGVEGRIDIEKLEKQNDLTSEQEQIITDVTLECMGLGDGGIPEGGGIPE